MHVRRVNFSISKKGGFEMIGCINGQIRKVRVKMEQSKKLKLLFKSFFNNLYITTMTHYVALIEKKFYEAELGDFGAQEIYINLLNTISYSISVYLTYFSDLDLKFEYDIEELSSLFKKKLDELYYNSTPDLKNFIPTIWNPIKTMLNLLKTKIDEFEPK